MKRENKAQAIIAIILLFSLIAVISLQPPREIQKGPNDLTGLSDNPHVIGYWSFDSNARNSTHVFDLSTKGNDGKIFGATFAEGAYGDGAYFDGIDNYIEIQDPNNDLSGMDELTVAFHIKRFVKIGPQAYLFKNNVWGPYSFRTYGNSAEVRAFLRNKTQDYVPGPESVSIVPEQYVSYVFTYNGATCKQYINGLLAREDDCPPGGVESRSGSLFLGMAHPGSDPYSYLNGSLDELVIFNKSLSGEEIEAIFGTFGCGDSFCSDIETSFLCPEDCFDSSLAGKLIENQELSVWYADSTQKILPSYSVPENQINEININLAQNEARFVQLAIVPSSDNTLEISSSSDAEIKTQIYSEEIVPIIVSSDHLPYFTGEMFDPLLKKTSIDLTEKQTSVILVEIITNKSTSPGDHAVVVEIGEESVSINVHVYDFTLPDTLTLATAFDSGHFRSQYEDLPDCEATSVLEFHGLPDETGYITPNELAVVDAYYENYAENKIVPYSPHEFRDFKYDCATGKFNFTDMDAILEKYINNLSMNSVMVKHYGGLSLCGHSTDDEEYCELATSYYGNITRHMEEKGWLDKSYIMVDEPHGIYLNYTRDVAKIITKNVTAPTLKMGPALNDLAGWEILNNSVNLWIAQNNEVRMPPIYTPEIGAKLINQGDEIWWYYTRSKVFDIDSPALGNTLNYWAAWRYNVTGILNWAALIYDTHCSDNELGQGMDNPWNNPRSAYGNGQINFYYPPCRDVCTEPTYEIVPSIRVKLYREGIQDYEYFEILEKSIAEAKSLSINTESAESALRRLDEVATTPTSWTNSPSLVVEVRGQIANQIELLLDQIACGQGGCQISNPPSDDGNNGDNGDNPPNDNNNSQNDSEDDFPAPPEDLDDLSTSTDDAEENLAGSIEKMFEGAKYFTTGLILAVLVVAGVIIAVAVNRKSKQIKDSEATVRGIMAR
ncbi:MAG: glycoside hydrolase domain-containing protein [archaeon]